MPTHVALGERERRIVALLVTENEALEPWTDPRTWTGSMVARAAQSGPGPSEKRDCERCEGIGRVVGNRSCSACARGAGTEHRCSVCPACEGKRRLWYDAYTGKAVDAPDRAAPKREGGAKARRHRGGSRVDLADQAHLWEKARRRHDYGTSRRALRAALQVLRDADPLAHRLLVACYIEGRYGPHGEPDLDEASALTLGRALQELSDLLPDVIDLPAELEQRANGAARAATARRLVASGMTRRAAARQLGLREGHLRALLRR